MLVCILSCVYMFISFMTTLLHTLEHYFTAFFSTFFAFQYFTVCHSMLELLLNSIYGNNRITKQYYYFGFKESLLCLYKSTNLKLSNHLFLPFTCLPHSPLFLSFHFVSLNYSLLVTNSFHFYFCHSMNNMVAVS